jgi:glycosyltransferase involved in cell wall biosynthesis
MGFNVKFIGDNFYRHQPYTQILQQLGVEVLYGGYYQKNIWEWLKTNGKYFDIVIGHRMHIAPKYFDFIKKYSNAKLAYVGHDLQYLSSLRKFEFTGEENHRLDSINFKKTETQIFNTVDIIFPFSTYEAPFIKQLVPGKIVKTIPVYFYENIPKITTTFNDRKDILFVGFFGHPPNIDAVLWFVNEVFPLVKNSIPDVKLHIVGSNPTEEILGLKTNSINVTGFVSDEALKNFYRNCKVAILPLRFGAGVKGKLLESLYYQIPSVITPVAAEGVPEIENYTLIADSPEDFSESIQQLYVDEKIWERFSVKGKELILKYYSEESARNTMEEVLLNVLNKY